MKCHSNSGAPSPLVKNILITKVKSKINTMPRTDRRIIFSGIFEINTRASVPISKKVKETALRQKNELIINRIENFLI